MQTDCSHSPRLHCSYIAQSWRAIDSGVLAPADASVTVRRPPSALLLWLNFVFNPHENVLRYIDDSSDVYACVFSQLAKRQRTRCENGGEEGVYETRTPRITPYFDYQYVYW